MNRSLSRFYNLQVPRYFNGLRILFSLESWLELFQQNRGHRFSFGSIKDIYKFTNDTAMLQRFYDHEVLKAWLS